jgi:hypothetical protein
LVQQLVLLVVAAAAQTITNQPQHNFKVLSVLQTVVAAENK